jgi:hypothetical protein
MKTGKKMKKKKREKERDEKSEEGDIRIGYAIL